MRSLVKKWSEAALAALCVLAIVFAALYTRQDDLRRLAARSAAESLDQRLEDARTPAPWRMPVPQPPETAYAGAERSAGGLWRFSPWIGCAVSYGQRVCAMQAGEVTFAEADEVRLLHDGGVETRYRGLQGLLVHTGERVAAGQALGTANGRLEVCALRGETYIDPQSLVP